VLLDLNLKLYVFEKGSFASSTAKEFCDRIFSHNASELDRRLVAPLPRASVHTYRHIARRIPLHISPHRNPANRERVSSAVGRSTALTKSTPPIRAGAYRVAQKSKPLSGITIKSY